MGEQAEMALDSTAMCNEKKFLWQEVIHGTKGQKETGNIS